MKNIGLCFWFSSSLNKVGHTNSCSKAFNISKRHDIGREGSRVRVIVGTIYYIITKVFIGQKNILN